MDNVNACTAMNRVKVIDFSPDFRPFPQAETAGRIEHIEYPSGVEPHVRVHLDKYAKYECDRIVITARVRSMDKLFGLANAAQLVRQEVSKEVTVFLPFLPHARQDRRVVPEDTEPLLLVRQMLGVGCNIDLVSFDVHGVRNHHRRGGRSFGPSPFHHRVLFDLVSEGRSLDDIVLVSPDHGASQRLRELVVDEVANGTPMNDGWPVNNAGMDASLTALLLRLRVLVCDKERDPSSGRIKGIRIPERDVRGATCVILDDICDGGGTFIPIAKALKERGAAKVVLCVSHGLFTKGFDALYAGGIDHIYTTDSFRDFENTERFTQIRDWSWTKLA